MLALFVLAAVIAVAAGFAGSDPDLAGSAPSAASDARDRAGAAAPDVARADGAVAERPDPTGSVARDIRTDGGGADQAGDPAAAPPAPAGDGYELRGRVFAFDNEPIAAARVLLLPPLVGRSVPPAAVGGATPNVTTTADGRFAIRFRDARARDVVVAAAGFAPVVVAGFDPAAVRAPGFELAVRLPRGATVHGSVRDEAGQQRAGVRVEAWLERTAPVVARSELGPRPLCPGGQFVAAVDTALDGSFRFDSLPGGAVVVGVAPTHGGERQRLTLGAGERRHVDLRLRDPGDIRGTADPGSLVVLYSAAVKRFATPDAERAFAFVGVPPGDWLLCAVCEPVGDNVHAIVQEFLVTGRSTLAREVTVVSGETQLVELPPARACTGTVRGSAWHDGRPAAGGEVILRPVNEVGAHVRRGIIAEDGSFEVPNVPGGSYDAELVPAGRESPASRQACRVRIGLVTELKLTSR